ncbi:efflux transporter outer membrane subunit [Comamonas sp. JUb58]|uniref:efflux transporter outer membrane subunit n=1 Tax=Comamonas sp. JUb58 TaxID=2485114 RepID=UPI00105C58C2|nr:efflux transporter outer membrane subunit [Comamonas sp. JUb58]TDS84990.1 multidrug efflux system outer membrane protein [Comamonas sp. JUb58]
MPVFQLTKTAAAVFLAASLSACSLAPTYKQPAAPVPTDWPDLKANSAGVPIGLADLVADKALLDLVAAAVDHNRDLRKALLNVEAARAQYGIQRAEQLPSISAQANGTRQRTAADLSQTGRASTTSVYQAGLGVTAFEVDLFGRLRNLSESALQEFFAIEQNAEAARISLSSEVMQAYITRNSAQSRLKLTERTLAAREKSLALTEQRRAAGAATALDLEDARGLGEQARADLEQVRRELRQANNALGLLTGSHAGAEQLRQTREGASIFALRDIGAGAPSDLLRDRPDILAAENSLKARHADIGVARAAFFPRLSLTAFLGSSSPELSDLFRGSSRAWSFAPQLTMPLFDGGRNQANLELAVVRRDIAVAQYEGAIQTAFREVADALAANDTLRNEVTYRKALLESSQRSLALSEARYKGGVDSSLRYLDAQRTSYDNELAYINIVAQRQTAIVSLFKALGGKWYLE